MNYFRHSLRVGACALLIAGYCSRPLRAAITISGDTSISSETISVGFSSFGTYRIDSGSTATTNNIVIGSQTTGVGEATVTGFGSMLSLGTNSTSDVGVSGSGQLDILDGAAVLAGTLRIGANNSGNGTVVVDAPGSILNVANQLLFSSSAFGGTFGNGLLRISNGGTVNVASTQNRLSSKGRIELDGGLLRINRLDNTGGTIIGSGEIMLPNTSLSNSGRIEANQGDVLRFTGSADVDNLGSIAASGGEIHFLQTVTTNNNVASEITLQNGVVRMSAVPFPNAFTNYARVISTGGVNEFYGRVTNQFTGQIAVTNQSVLSFHDDVTAIGGTVSVLPGSKAVFLEDLSMNGGSILLATLAGTNPDTDYGQIEVASSAQLAGVVDANLMPGFTPQEGDSFTLMSASSISGSLALGDMPVLIAGLMWDLDVVANQQILSVVPGLAGDYNKNSVVDAADYVLWNRSMGQTGLDVAADGDANGVVDFNDYTFWRARFGNALPPPPGALTAVPEPAALTLVFAAMSLVLCGRRLRSKIV